MLKIIGWNEGYETHDTIRYNRLPWVRQNILCTNMEWAKLTLHPEVARSVWFGWTALVWYVALTNRAGLIDAPADDISLLTRVPAEDISAAIAWAQGAKLVADVSDDGVENRENEPETAFSEPNAQTARGQRGEQRGDNAVNSAGTTRKQRGDNAQTARARNVTLRNVTERDVTLTGRYASPSPIFLKKSPLLSSPGLTVVNTNTCASAKSDSGDDLISANSAGASDGKGEEILINNGRGEEIASDLATRMAEMAASARRLAGMPTDADDAAPREEERNILSLIPEDACERIDRLTGKPSATYCRIIANNEMVAAGIATATRSELEARAAEVAKRLSSEKSTEKVLEARQSTKTGEHARKDTKPAPSHATAPEKGIAAEPHPSREEFLAFCREIDPSWGRAEEYYTNLSATGWQLLPRRGETERRPIVNWRRFTAALINNQRGAK